MEGQVRGSGCSSPEIQKVGTEIQYTEDNLQWLVSKKILNHMSKF